MVKKPAFWRDLDNERTQLIIRMTRERASEGDIALALDCSRALVWQVVGHMKREHGEGVFSSANRTVQEAASELGVSQGVIERLCRENQIPVKRRGDKDTGAYIITEDGMRALRAHRLITKKRKCAVCKKKFVCGSGRRVTCSDECKEERERRFRKKYSNLEPTPDDLKGWMRKLLERLHGHKIPGDENWLTITKASKRSCLSTTQLAWLRLRNVVTIHHDSNKKWRGKPVAMYAASEMDIAREVYVAEAAHSGPKN